MINLYRGLIDILIYSSRQMDEMFTTHIRGENGNGEDNSGDFGVSGFWNFLLEVVCLLFVKTFIIVGTILMVSLAIMFFPLYAIMTSILNIINHRAIPFEDNRDYVEPK